jgi:hypothetical protein
MVSTACSVFFSPLLAGSNLLGFEPQLLSHRLPIKVYVLGADLTALNLSERSQRIGDGATGSWGSVHQRAGVGAVQNPLNGDQASSGVPLY